MTIPLPVYPPSVLAVGRIEVAMGGGRGGGGELSCVKACTMQGYLKQQLSPQASSFISAFFPSS